MHFHLRRYHERRRKKKSSFNKISGSFLPLPCRNLQLAGGNQEGAGVAASVSHGAAELPPHPQGGDRAGGCWAPLGHPGVLLSPAGDTAQPCHLLLPLPNLRKLQLELYLGLFGALFSARWIPVFVWLWAGKEELRSLFISLISFLSFIFSSLSFISFISWKWKWIFYFSTGRQGVLKVIS